MQRRRIRVEFYPLGEQALVEQKNGIKKISYQGVSIKHQYMCTERMKELLRCQSRDCGLDLDA